MVKPTPEQLAAAERRRIALADWDSDHRKTWKHGDFEFGHATVAYDTIILADLALQHLDASRDDGAAVEVRRTLFVCLGYSPGTPGIVKPVTLECTCCGSQIRVPFAEYEAGKYDRNVTLLNINLAGA